jgi:hypothetical protein
MRVLDFEPFMPVMVPFSSVHQAAKRLKAGEVGVPAVAIAYGRYRTPYKTCVDPTDEVIESPGSSFGLVVMEQVLLPSYERGKYTNDGKVITPEIRRHRSEQLAVTPETKWQLAIYNIQQVVPMSFFQEVHDERQQLAEETQAGNARYQALGEELQEMMNRYVSRITLEQFRASTRWTTQAGNFVTGAIPTNTVKLSAADQKRFDQMTEERRTIWARVTTCTERLQVR